MVWKASSINTGIDDYASMNTFCNSSSGFGCSTCIAANNFGYNVQVGGASSHLINAIIPLFIFKRVTTYDEMDRTAPDRSKKRIKIYIFELAHLPIPEVLIKMNPIYTKLEYKTTKDQFDIGIAYILIDG